MLEDVMTIINTTGFPIACVLFLAFYVRELNASHKEEVKALSDSLSDLVLEIKELASKVTTLIDEEREERRNENK